MCRDTCADRSRIWLQGRPAEAALLTALLAPDPKRRPVIDDVLRSGLLRKLHAGLTMPLSAPAAQSGEAAVSAAGVGATAAAAAARTAGPAPAAQPMLPAGAGMKQEAALLQRQAARQTSAAPLRPRLATGRSAAPAAALAEYLGSGGALQDFLQLARDAVGSDAAHLASQLSVLDQVSRCRCNTGFCCAHVSSSWSAWCPH